MPEGAEESNVPLSLDTTFRIAGQDIDVKGFIPEDLQPKLLGFFLLPEVLRDPQDPGQVCLKMLTKRGKRG